MLRGFQQVLFSLVVGLQASFVAAGEIAITLDDLPYLMPTGANPTDGEAIVRGVNAALAEHDIVAMGFAVGRQITRRNMPSIHAFVDAGHQIANHSWSHGDYNDQSQRTFRREVRKTDKVLEPFLAPQKYYRFPYLREGESEGAKAEADAVLEEFGYVNVPVSIDNDEWRYNLDYVLALDAGDTEKAAKIVEDYLAHMKARTDYFQSLAQDALGRDVKHIPLLHMNQINADHLGTLLDWYAAQGWQFITVKEALSDPVYSMPDLYAGPRGLSQIERVIP